MLLFVRCVTMGNAMPQISRTALVPYSAEQMYQLVNDVQSLFRDAPGAAFWSPARRR